MSYFMTKLRKLGTTWHCQRTLISWIPCGLATDPAAMSGNNSEGLMHDPYASSGSSGSLMTPPPLPSADDFHPVAPSSAPADDLFLNIPSAKAKPPQPDFLFDENYDESFRRSWGERLTYHVGAAYSAGAQPALYVPVLPPACCRGQHTC